MLRKFIASSIILLPLATAPEQLPGKIIVIGSAMYDQVIECAKDEITEDILSGIKIDIRRVRCCAGGGCINCARVFHHLGLPIIPFFKVGNDQLGTILLNQISEDDIDTSFAQRDPKMATGTSFIIPTPSGNRTLFVYRGANETLSGAELNLENLPEKPSGIYIAPTNIRLLIDLVNYARKHKISVMHNPSRTELTSHADTLEMQLPCITILQVNRQEAELFFKHLEPKENFSLTAFFTAVHQRGTPLILLTDGSHGAYLAKQNSILYHPCPSAEVKCTVGAGDALGATFFGALLYGVTEEDALRASIMQSIAQVTGTPQLSLAALLERVQNEPSVIHKKITGQIFDKGISGRT
ncbi:MAG: carbohydrate kinase family protein [Candidatus Babeliaceae bacterium]|nr:carbohydrate kinase family protein [Candidatus Babeliaceae bacterium]